MKVPEWAEWQVAAAVIEIASLGRDPGRVIRSLVAGVLEEAGIERRVVEPDGGVVKGGRLDIELGQPGFRCVVKLDGHEVNWKSWVLSAEIPGSTRFDVQVAVLGRDAKNKKGQ